MGTTLIPPFATTNAQSDRAMAALAQANRVRLRRAALMRWLHGSSNADSHQKAAELVLGPDPAVHSMLVLELLGRIAKSDRNKRSECSNSLRSHPLAR